MLSKSKIVLMALTFIVGLLAVNYGSRFDSGTDKTEFPDLREKMVFAVNPAHKGEFFGWKQLRAVNATVTNVKILVQDPKANKSELYTYVYTESQNSASLTVYAELIESGQKYLYEIEDDDLDSVADPDSGQSVDFPSEVPGEINNRRVKPIGKEAKTIQDIYNRSISLLPMGLTL